MITQIQMNPFTLRTFLIFLLYNSTTSPHFTTACNIHGTNSGICTNKYHPSTYATNGDELDLNAIQQAKAQWMADMPYCGRWIASYYFPCVPSSPTNEWAHPDANFEFGRLTTGGGDGTMTDASSVKTKDKWVEETVTNTIQSRIEAERAKGKSHYHFYQNKDCQEAFARYSCWLNFPRCDEFEESLPQCQSACENMFRVCKFAPDLWRCGADVVDGDDEYDIRAFFPGQPFKKNEFLPKSDGEPRAVCTPSIKGSGHEKFGMGAWLALILFVCFDFVSTVLLLVA
ncbi:hypothetical protein HJC23_002408 [Cyclotella cryptica]|eukprot:CCRYP_004520-RA/>CCRYP_004520-RA protein AED:0.39 eAED:0.39 QI:0/-1/0/1/-1/1/1/0/285